MVKRVAVRLGVLLVTLLLLPLTLAGPAQAAKQFDVFSLPFNASPNECIGGEQCGGPANTIDFFLQPGVMVVSITVDAHDDIGDRRNAVLDLLLDGVLIDSKDVKSAGSILVFPVNRPGGSKITFRSRHKNNDPGGDETHIDEVILRK
jgi:hypothetical protein